MSSAASAMPQALMGWYELPPIYVTKKLNARRAMQRKLVDPSTY